MTKSGQNSKAVGDRGLIQRSASQLLQDEPMFASTELPWTQGILLYTTAMSKGRFKFHSLLHSSSILDKRLDTLLTPLGIKPKQARILNVLKRIGPSSQKVLAEQFDVTSGSMSTMIDRLLAAGLVHREKHPDDKRTDIISLSERGCDVLVEVRDVWREIDDLIVEKLGAEKAALFNELTRELKYALGGRVIGHPDHPVKSKGRTKSKPERERKA